VLSGVHQTVFDLVKVLQFFDDWSDFHEVWPCPNYAQKPDHRESPAVIRLRIIGSQYCPEDDDGNLPNRLKGNGLAVI
jgi:hypothetical protein